MSKPLAFIFIFYFSPKIIHCREETEMPTGGLFSPLNNEEVYNRLRASKGCWWLNDGD